MTELGFRSQDKTHLDAQDSTIIVDGGDLIFQHNSSLNLLDSTLYLLSGYVIFADNAQLNTANANVLLVGGDLVFLDNSTFSFQQFGQASGGERFFPFSISNQSI